MPETLPKYNNVTDLVITYQQTENEMKKKKNKPSTTTPRNIPYFLLFYCQPN